jgi:hypothetical protein
MQHRKVQVPAAAAYRWCVMDKQQQWPAVAICKCSTGRYRYLQRYGTCSSGDGSSSMKAEVVDEQQRRQEAAVCSCSTGRYLPQI